MKWLLVDEPACNGCTCNITPWWEHGAKITGTTAAPARRKKWSRVVRRSAGPVGSREGVCDARRRRLGGHPWSVRVVGGLGRNERRPTCDPHM